MAIFTNRANLSYNNQTISSNVATGEILEVLSATKTAVGESYADGTDLTYVVSILNSGTSPITGVTVTDDLGGYGVSETTYYPLAYVADSVRLFIGGVPAAAPVVTGTAPVTFSGITIPAGGNAILVYETAVTEFAPLGTGSTVTNKATVNGTGITTAVEASATVPVAEAANLSITKSITPTQVTENSRVTYTFVIENFGNTEADAAGNVTVTDLFSPILADLAVTLNGTALTAGTGYSYDTTTGQFATTPGVITVPAATFTQDPVTGIITTTPGQATLTVTGTV